MPVSLLTNIPAMAAERHLEESSTITARAEERLASGKRINRASDDAAGLALADQHEARARAIGQAKRNTQDALGFVQVAEGAMNESENMLVRLRELAVQGANEDLSDRQRGYLDLEAKSLVAELGRIANVTSYSNVPLLNGAGSRLEFQIGPDNDDFNRIAFQPDEIDLRPEALGVDGVSVGDAGSSRDAIDAIDGAINQVATPRARLGALQSRLETVTRELSTTEEGLYGAVSRIRDADVAREATEVARGMILQRTGAAVLAQANQFPAIALRLIDW